MVGLPDELPFMNLKIEQHILTVTTKQREVKLDLTKVLRAKPKGFA